MSLPPIGTLLRRKRHSSPEHGNLPLFARIDKIHAQGAGAIATTVDLHPHLLSESTIADDYEIIEEE